MSASEAESLWDEILPVEVKPLPGDLDRLDALLSDPGLLAPIGVRCERLLAETGASSGRGRPTIAMDTYVRLMIVKHRSGYGYETLMREVSDSIHLRRFCRIGIQSGCRTCRRFAPAVIRGGARDHARTDSEGQAGEAIPAPGRSHRLDRRGGGTPAGRRTPGLAADGVKALAREGHNLAARVGEKRTAVRDRSRSMGRKLRALTRTIRRRSGEAKREVLELTEHTGQLLEASIKEAKALAAIARWRARGRGAQAKHRESPRIRSRLPLFLLR
jgi:IS5 family transposase